MAAAELSAHGVLYDLRRGSELRDDCLNCDRAPIVRPLQGTFALVLKGIGLEQSYTIEELAISDSSGEYQLEGQGALIFHSRDATQSLQLELTINGVPNVILESELAAASPDFPAFAGSATEDGSRMPLHVYTVTLVAAPRVTMQRYELQEGSTLFFQCPTCRFRPIPLAGSFELGRINDEVVPVGLFRIDAIDWSSSDPEIPTSVVGSGLYRQGGEVALTQSMQLTLDNNEDLGKVLASEDPIVQAQFPAISIDLIQTEPGPLDTRWVLKLLAQPAKETLSFCRGDCNGDGQTVGVGDALASLVFNFVGGVEFPCRAACDANGDGATVGVADAIYLLQHNFLGGPEPPAPFPDCGAGGDSDRNLGCEVPAKVCPCG